MAQLAERSLYNTRGPRFKSSLGQQNLLTYLLLTVEKIRIEKKEAWNGPLKHSTRLSNILLNGKVMYGCRLPP